MIELRTLGTCQIVVGEERIGPQSPYAFALALYLAVERGRRHSRDELLPVFFPGVPEANAAHSLRQNLYKLRQLGVPAETTAAGTIIPAADVQDDYSVLLATGELPDPQAERLPGEFLPGYWPRISDEYTRWLDVQRDAVNSALRRAYVSRILDRRAVARWDEVERFARGCLAIDPLNEEATLALAEALALSGSKAAGVKVLDRYLEEIGAEAGSLTLPASVLRRRISERYRPARVVGELPLIGREEEVRVLHDALTGALSGSGGSIWVSGEPGIGKTRLLREFTSLATLSGARIVTAECQPQDIQHPLRIFYDVVPQLMALPGALGASAQSLALLKGLNAASAATDSPGHPAPRLLTRAGDAVQLVTDALCDLLGAITEEGTLVLAVDDTHWADATSRKVFRLLWDSPSASRLLLIVASREPIGAHFRLSGQRRQLRLTGIDTQRSIQFLREASSRLGRDVSDDIIARSLGLGAGNPFFLRLLAEHFSQHPDASAPPPRLRELIAERVLGATHEAQSILITCATLSRHSTIPRIEAVLEMPRYKLAAGIAELEARNLILADGNLVSVAHPLIADCALSVGGAAQLGVIRGACAELLESAARSTGNLSLFWDAHDIWSAHGASSAAARCAADAAKLDALSVIVRTMDANFATFEKQAKHGDDTTDSVATLDEPGRLAAQRTPTRDSAICDPPRSSPDGWSLLSLASDKGNSPAARLRAAVAALTISEYDADARLAEQAYTAACEAGHNTDGNAKADLDRAIMAYHCAFGDHREALQCVHNAESQVPIKSTALVVLRIQMNAAEALTRCGQCERSLALLERIHSAATEFQIDEKRENTVVRAVWIARQIGNSRLKELWDSRSSSLAGNPQAPSHLSYLYNKGLDASDCGDWQTLESLAVRLRERLPIGSSTFHELLVSSLQIRAVAELRPQDLDDFAVQRVSDWVLLTSTINPRDDAALSVVKALMTHSQQQGRHFVDEYLQRRRKDTFPILTALKREAASL